MISPTVTAGPKTERIHAMDSLRAFAMLLGIFLHAAMPFMTFDIPWGVHHHHRHLAFDALVGGVHPFRMQLFFLIGGFFGRILYYRLGPRGFFWHRFKRIFVPFVAGMLLIVPIVLRLLDARLESFATVHMWFLEYLLVYYLAALAGGPLLVWALGGRQLDWMDRMFANLNGAAWKPLALAGPLVAVMWFSPMWADVDGGAGQSIVPRAPGLIYYGMFFAFGWFLQRQPELLERIEERTWSSLGWALPAFLVMGGLLFFESRKDIPFYAGIKLVCLIAGAVYTWLMIFGTMGFFLRYMNWPHPAIRYIADSSYWLYLAHLPLVIFLQIWLCQSNWDAFTTFGAINLIALIALYASYHFLVRYTFVGAILNGPRVRSLPESGVAPVRGVS